MYVKSPLMPDGRISSAPTIDQSVESGYLNLLWFSAVLIFWLLPANVVADTSLVIVLLHLWRNVRPSRDRDFFCPNRIQLIVVTILLGRMRLGTRCSGLSLLGAEQRQGS